MGSTYTEEGFYDFKDGAIGMLQYKAAINLTDEQRQEIVSRNANARLRAWMNNFTYGMNGNGPADPTDAYAKARKDSWGDFEDTFYETKSFYFQMGNNESVKRLELVEKSEEFIEWMNPWFIEAIKQKHNSNG